MADSEPQVDRFASAAFRPRRGRHRESRRFRSADRREIPGRHPRGSRAPSCSTARPAAARGKFPAGIPADRAGKMPKAETDPKAAAGPVAFDPRKGGAAMRETAAPPEKPRPAVSHRLMRGARPGIGGRSCIRREGGKDGPGRERRGRPRRFFAPKTRVAGRTGLCYWPVIC